mmetsp:Transcript_33138/g.94201  ORF Transcript_33138/g.94201 Transcript_33138/m.94201 type:complete len:200 (-) Transcript_33138:117-716(-)
MAMSHPPGAASLPDGCRSTRSRMLHNGSPSGHRKQKVWKCSDNGHLDAATWLSLKSSVNQTSPKPVRLAALNSTMSSPKPSPEGPSSSTSIAPPKGAPAEAAWVSSTLAMARRTKRIASSPAEELSAYSSSSARAGTPSHGPMSCRGSSSKVPCVLISASSVARIVRASSASSHFRQLFPHLPRASTQLSRLQRPSSTL